MIGHLATVVAALAAGNVGSNLRYVDDDAPPGGDGMSWKTPYRFLQSALADAAGGGVTEVRVAQGTYLPDRTEATPKGSGDRTATFLMNGDDLSFLGGFAGVGAADPDERDVVAYQTILSGDIDGDNSYHVVTVGNTTFPSIDGFTVRLGNANGPGIHSRGGGLLNAGSGPTITRCRFENNHADTHGGGIGNTDTSFGPNLSDSVFVGNTAAFGGGMSLGDFDGTVPPLTDCVFQGNAATQQGGGFYVFNALLAISDCTFTDNTAVEGGGAHIDSAGGTIERCVFVGNMADAGGGAFVAGFTTLSRCTFAGNDATDGGGLYVEFADPSVQNSVFSGNTATFGDAAFARFANPSMVNTSVLASGGSLGTITAENSTWTLDNCIVAGAGLAFWPINEDLPALGHCVLNSDFWQGQAVVEADPRFIDPDGADDLPGTADDDLRLRPGSPCIDRGKNASVPGGVTTDFDGIPRFFDDPCTVDSGAGTSPIVDVGAFEFSGTSCDLDGSGAVSTADLLALLAGWGPCADCLDCPGDFDGDCVVGTSDLLILLASWG